MSDHGSWGLSLFVLFELTNGKGISSIGSWGLSLFVLFEHENPDVYDMYGSWGLSLFVLFEPPMILGTWAKVLED